MALYCCKPPTVVMGIHEDEQLPAMQSGTLNPINLYGIGTFVVADLGGPAPGIQWDPPPVEGGSPIFKGYLYPTITATILAFSVKLECRLRILAKISEQAQRNVTTRINDIQMARMTQAPARPPTPEEQADMDTAAAIWDWIGRPNGMQQTSDDLIAANDQEWYSDVKWPAWNSAWDTFVDRF